MKEKNVIKTEKQTIKSLQHFMKSEKARTKFSGNSDRLIHKQPRCFIESAQKYISWPVPIIPYRVNANLNNFHRHFSKNGQLQTLKITHNMLEKSWSLLSPVDSKKMVSPYVKILKKRLYEKLWEDAAQALWHKGFQGPQRKFFWFQQLQMFS